MKLLRCRIESFGKLENFEYAFDGGLNSVCRENGAGKTTLASFICAMLYGMETSRANDKGQKERSRYAPWSGGRFAGMLELSCGGKSYRIERTFDRQSAAKDQIKVYDVTSGAVETTLEPNPGEALLGIPREAFLRTAYLSCREIGNVDGLLPKINRYLSGSFDTDLYGTAAAILQNKRRDYKLEKGRGGSLDRLLQDKKDAERELAMCLSAAEAAEEHERLRQSAIKRRKECADRLALASAYADAMLCKRTHEEFLQKEKNANEALRAFTETMGGKKPLDDEQIERAKELQVKIDHYRGKLRGEALEEGEKAVYARLRACFEGAGTSEDEIDGAKERLLKTKLDRQRLKEAEEVLSSEEYKALSDHFSAHCPTDGDLKTLAGLKDEYLAAKAENERYNNELLEAAKKKVAPKKVFSKRAKIACGAGLGCIALAILFFALSLPAPWVFLILGLGAFAYGFYDIYTSDRQEKNAPVEQDERIPERYRAAQTAFGDRLNYYGYFGEDLALLLDNLTEDRARYLEKKESYDRAASLCRELRKSIAANEEETKQFETRFPDYFRGEPEQSVKYLKDDFKRYSEITGKLEAAKKQADEDQDSLDVLLDEFHALLYPLCGEIPEGEERAALAGQIALSARSKALIEGCAARRHDAEEYLAAHPYSSVLPLDVPSDEEKEKLQSDMLALQTSIGQAEKKLEDENRIADRAGEYRARIREIEEEYAKQAREYRILTAAKSYLELADRQLRGRYTAPLLSAYVRNAEKIDPALTDGVTLAPKELSLSFERAGEYRKIDAFSSGFTALSDICLRLAMIDVAYPDERPFLILDDPFVWLDDENLKKALRALRELSDNTQILYFTCHSDRRADV